MKYLIDLKGAIVFAILMESGKGILNKAPIYIEEKLSKIEKLNKPEVLLDPFNMRKFEEYKKRWKVCF